MTTKYEKQRPNKVPPHVSLQVLRRVSGLTLAQVCDRAASYLRRTDPEAKFTVGALSGIENGHRGASLRVIEALEFAYNIEPGSIVTDYLPRQRGLELIQGQGA